MLSSACSSENKKPISTHSSMQRNTVQNMQPESNRNCLLLPSSFLEGNDRCGRRRLIMQVMLILVSIPLVFILPPIFFCFRSLRLGFPSGSTYSTSAILSVPCVHSRKSFICYVLSLSLSLFFLKSFLSCEEMERERIPTRLFIPFSRCSLSTLLKKLQFLRRVSFRTCFFASEGMKNVVSQPSHLKYYFIVIRTQLFFFKFPP